MMIPPREADLRKLIHRLAKPESGVSREFSILSVDDAVFLLTELDLVRAQLAELKGTTA